MNRNTGLYIRFGTAGKIEKTLVSAKGEIRTEQSTVAKEIISFLDLSMSHFADVAEAIDNLGGEIEFDAPDCFGMVKEDVFVELLSAVRDVIDCMEDEDIFHGTLFRTMMEDAVPPDDGTAMYIYQTKADICQSVSNILRVQFAMDCALQRLCHGAALDMDRNFPEISQVDAVQILSMNNGLKTEYFFRSICNYYCYLFLRFLSGKPRVARCECCGRFFIPKTKKATLYCDRVIKNGKTCKQTAPQLKGKINIEKDEVLQTFERVKQKMYKRFERSCNSLNTLAHGLTMQEYDQWLEKATQAKNRYAIGEITAEQALSEIEVSDG